MGLFNRVLCSLPCPACGREELFWVQFKYGARWQFDYAIGDTLRWRIGKPGHARVLVGGIGEACPHCHVDGAECAITLEYDRICAVTLVFADDVIGDEYIVVVP